jgi:hypothetical protein
MNPSKNYEPELCLSHDAEKLSGLAVDALYFQRKFLRQSGICHSHNARVENKTHFYYLVLS